MDELFKGESCLAEYIKDKKWIKFSFKGYPRTEEHKEMYMKALEFLKTNKTVAFVNDFRGLKGTFSMLSDWTIELFKPAVELGLKRSALVLNDDIFTQFAANDVLNKIKLIEVQAFDNMEDAEKWCSEIE